ncbi:MAG: hypothetical protein IKK39_11120, partial [Thermoguttaceae bacterium]|nr:hypothetical protein [Thermoguttaceae bacterium]
IEILNAKARRVGVAPSFDALSKARSYRGVANARKIIAKPEKNRVDFQFFSSNSILPALAS